MGSETEGTIQTWKSVANVPQSAFLLLSDSWMCTVLPDFEGGANALYTVFATLLGRNKSLVLA